MDGIHDLGGRQGFGHVEADEKEEAFHSDWEARVFALVRAMSKKPEWTIDRFRFTREQIDPVDYLTRPYYDQWLQCYAALMIESGLADVGEIATGTSATGKPDLPPPAKPETVEAQRKDAAVKFDRPYDKPFRFKAGDNVRTLAHAHGGHTRLPGYARGCEGVVAHVRGGFIFPDDAAQGIERAQPLYTVRFDASQFWPEDGLKHSVHIDLWESYLEPA